MNNIRKVEKPLLEFNLMQDSSEVSAISKLHFEGIEDQSFYVSKSSHYIVPFLLTVFDLEKSDTTNAIEKAIIELDDLAIRVDSIIDSLDCNSFSIAPCVKLISKLDESIRECLFPLKNHSKYQELITETLCCVEMSLQYNTVDRHLIYDLQKELDVTKCTTYYLFPLLCFLISHSKTSYRRKDIFYLIANYIQIIDDFVDVFDDVKSDTPTPISTWYKKKKQDCCSSLTTQNTPFENLVHIVIRKTEDYLFAIENELDLINPRKGKQLLSEWYQFQSQFKLVPIPNGNETQAKQYLKKVRKIVPPIISYTSG
jgi:hypothetical protein